MAADHRSSRGGATHVTRLLNILSLPCSACQPCCTYTPQTCDAAISPSAIARCFGIAEDLKTSSQHSSSHLPDGACFRAQCVPHSAKSFQTSLLLQGLRTHFPNGA